MLYKTYITPLTSHIVSLFPQGPKSQSIKESFSVSDLIINNTLNLFGLFDFHLLEHHRNYIINDELRNRFEPLTGCARKSATKIYIDR